MSDQLEILRSLAVATLIGALIGLEREYRSRLKGEKAFAGLRTFMFYALIGNLATWLSRLIDPVILPVTFVGLILLVSATYFRGSGGDADRGMTTEVVALITFLLGSTVAAGQTEVAVALGVIVAVLLSAKPTLLRWVEKLTPEDIYTTLKFAVVTFVVLPILPNRTFGPFDAFNPHQVWLMVVLISGVSFLGYVAFKLFGPERGIVLSGLLGGLASSTAVALSFSRRSQENPALSRGCALAIVIASTVMAARIAVLVAVIQPDLFRLLWLPLTAIALAGTGASVWLYLGARHDTRDVHELQIQNPFRLTSVLAFGAAFALVLFLVKASQHALPDAGTTLIAAISGLTQVDAITLSVSKLAGTSVSQPLAVTAVVVAALSNTLSKALIGVAGGNRRLRRPLLIGLGIIFAAGLLSLAAVPLL